MSVRVSGRYYYYYSCSTHWKHTFIKSSLRGSLWFCWLAHVVFNWRCCCCYLCSPGFNIYDEIADEEAYSLVVRLTLAGAFEIGWWKLDLNHSLRVDYLDWLGWMDGWLAWGVQWILLAIHRTCLQNQDAWMYVMMVDAKASLFCWEITLITCNINTDDLGIIVSGGAAAAIHACVLDKVGYLYLMTSR